MAGAVAFAAPALFAFAQAGTVTIPIFVGDTANLTLGSWGSGKAERNTDDILLGNSSIKVTTQGLYQGARLDFKTPVDLTPAFNNPKTYMRFQFHFTGAGATQQTFDPATGETRAASATPFEHMRFLLTMADGSRRELIRPVAVPPGDDPDSWVPVSFPVSALLKSPVGQAPAAAASAAPPTGDAARVVQIAVFGDRYQEFQIGEISVITDETEINIAPLDEPVAFINDAIAFTGQAEAGAATLRYSWDFDGDKKEDRVGQSVQHTWRKPGTYAVTLTVSDQDNIKKPASVSVSVNVAE